MIIPVKRVLIRESPIETVEKFKSCKELEIDDERVRCGEVSFPTETIDDWGVFDHGDFFDIFIGSTELKRYGLDHFHVDVAKKDAEPLIDFLKQKFPEPKRYEFVK